MIKILLNSLLNIFSFKLFHNRLPFFYNLFNIFFESNILNKNLIKLDDYKEIRSLFLNGYSKLDLQLGKNFENLKKKLYEQEIKKNSKNQYRFKINDEISKIIKKIYYSEITKITQKLENFYNSKIIPAEIYIARNYKFEDLQNEYYSHKLHMDGYVCTYLKLFINISDVNENNGPLHVVSKKDSKHLIKKLKYKDRNNYNSDKNIDYIKHTGQSGSVFICNTTQCFHRAGVPKDKFTRDMMTITLVAIPSNNLKVDFFLNFSKFNNFIIQEGNLLAQKLKPKNIRDTIKLYKDYKNYKGLN